MTIKIKNIILLVVSTLTTLLASAQNQSSVHVTLLNNTFKHVNLVNAYGDNKQVYASADIKGNAFNMNLNISNDVYRFDFGDENYFLVVITPGENMELTIDAEDLQSIVSATNSPSMSFVQEVSNLTNRKKETIDSLNSALQSDKKQLYWSKITQNVISYRQATDEIDRNLIAVFNSADTLEDIFSTIGNNGKVKSSNLDLFCSDVTRCLRDIDNKYRPFANFIANENYYDFKSNRQSDNIDYYTLLDSYLAAINERHQIASNALNGFTKEVKKLLNERDSLVYLNYWDKKSNKSNWAGKVFSTLKPSIDKIQGAQNAYQTNVEMQKSVGAQAVSGAQEIVKNIVSDYQKAYNEADVLLNNDIKNAIRTNKDDIAVLLFLDLFPKDKNTALHEEVIKALYVKYPYHPIVKERWNAINSPAGKTSIGAQAPELAFPDPEGNIRKLSDLRGKVVLVDFWASWCGPCRRESPNVRNVYTKYHDLGFEVFSVSLDRDAYNWKKAIKDDQLVWPNHVSDLKYWQSEAAAIYGVRSIPCMFLLDRDGRIVAKDLRGPALESAVRQLLGL